MLVVRLLVIAWIATIAGAIMGWVATIDALIVVPPFVAILLAIVTVLSAAPIAILRRTILYRGALGLLLASSATVLVPAGSTVFIDHAAGSKLLGFVALATTNLIVTILGWRALVRPAPRRAAIVALLAVSLELFGMVFDLVFNLVRRNPVLKDDDFTLLFIAALATTACGALVAIASLVSFDRPAAAHVPAARVASNGE